MTDVTADVIAIIMKPLPINKRERTLNLDVPLDELGVDSFAMVEMIFDLEEKFDIQIPYNSNDTALRLETVGDVVRAIQKLVDERP